MSDQLSKAEYGRCLACGRPTDAPCGGIDGYGLGCTNKIRIESAAAPVEVDVPTIDRDEAFQRDYIPLGRSGWEIQTKGKGSTYRICDKDGDRLAIPDTPYLHETLTRMARDVHADYATLARQLAEAKAENGRLMTIAGWGGLAGDAPERLILASEAYDGISCCDKWIDVRRVTDGEQPIPASATAYVRADLHEQAESQLAEATRRLGEVEAEREALRQAAHGLRFDVFSLTTNELQAAFDGKQSIAVVDMDTVAALKSALQKEPK